ncbi:unnamed protein product [Bursaphelenchus xylophilus]|uniref:(pine wood nematode) hypothetical protein n=1 Tax=Bursaphelenchus xylophilus TaxID=6326 RepID=A0A1I7SVX2_BURXY|nr:unnamed protein product [Bursaphelenchus xylophilus]CAG9098434.1 unnamed protein product [Bursaphelenchus xylophilus]
MLFFAWSLVSSAVQYTRRRRLHNLIRSHLLGPLGKNKGLLCRSRKDHLSSLFSKPFRYGEIRKAPSEPILNSHAQCSDHVIYHADDLDVISIIPTELKINEWIPSFSNNQHIVIGTDSIRITFSIKIHSDNIPSTSKSDFVKLATSGVAENNTIDTYLIDQFANRIARKKDGFDEMLYEADLENFCLIVIYWAEGNLSALNGSWKVSEIISVRLPDLRGLFSDQEPSSRTDSCSSLSVYPSFLSLNACRSTSAQRTHDINSRPYTLLEWLYQKEHGLGVNNYYIHSGRRANESHPQLQYISDTALHLDLEERPTRFSSAAPSSSVSWNRSQALSVRYRSLSPSSGNSRTHQRRSYTRGYHTYSNPRDSSFQEYNCYKDPYKDYCSDDQCVPTYFKNLRSRGQSQRLSARTNNNSSHPSRSSTIEDFEDSELKNETLSVSSNQTCLDAPQGIESVPEYNGDSARDKVTPLASELRVDPQIATILAQRDKADLLQRLNSDLSGRMEMERLSAENGTHRKRFNSLTPFSLGSKIEWSQEFFQPHSDTRRRSLSPLSLSLLANYGSQEQIGLVSAQDAPLTTDFVFRRRRSTATSRRRFHSMSSSANGDESSGKPKAKPPTVLIYTGDKPELYGKIVNSLKTIMPPDVYTLTHLSSKALKYHPWVDENAACLLIADTKLLDDISWSRLQNYFIHSGKILFICQNSLFASLTHCDSVKKQTSMLKSAFGTKTAMNALGKEFEQFMKRTIKLMAKKKEINETFYAKDPVGGYKYSVVLSMKKDQPLLLYMENSEHKASALFSDATTEQLLSEAGKTLISEAMGRLGIQVQENLSDDSPKRCYLICQEDKVIYEMNRLKYGVKIGSTPKMVFKPSVYLDSDDLPSPSFELLPVEVRRRKTGIPIREFDTQEYFTRLNTKYLGRVLLYVPVCESTIAVSRSLSSAIKNDGVLVVAGKQTNGVGRGGNQWLSPHGCAMFTFDFDIPLNSELGRNIVFVQHILAVAVVEAVLELLEMPDFPLKIKWPNDIYYMRSYKMGGVLIGGSTKGGFMKCLIAAGINVANSHPTVCINDMLPVESDKVLTVEEVLAVTMNKFEYFADLFVKKGKKDFLAIYHKHWLHTREEVTVIHEENGQKDKVVIRGLDDNGYLEVRSKHSGKVFSVFDDGNTFDMMKGLIHPKGK